MDTFNIEFAQTQRKYFTKECLFMLFIGIDVAKSKHDCCIIDSNGVIITDSLRISNSKEGFETLYNIIISVLDSSDISNAK